MNDPAGESMSDDISKLTSLERSVMFDNATEPPFANEFDAHWQQGIYVDKLTKQPLFSSRDKYDAGCGWPSFSDSIKGVELITIPDTSHQMERTEVRSPSGQIHLGHVFEDKSSSSGLRYCINSASLEFVPLSEMKAKSYEAYLSLFSDHE